MPTPSSRPRRGWARRTGRTFLGQRAVHREVRGSGGPWLLPCFAPAPVPPSDPPPVPPRALAPPPLVPPAPPLPPRPLDPPVPVVPPTPLLPPSGLIIAPPVPT